MRDIWKFAAKFPGFNNPAELPSETTQLRHMKKPVITKLWRNLYPVMSSVWLLYLLSFLFLALTISVPVSLLRQDIPGVDYSDNAPVMAQIAELRRALLAKHLHVFRKLGPIPDD